MPCFKTVTFVKTGKMDDFLFFLSSERAIFSNHSIIGRFIGKYRDINLKSVQKWALIKQNYAFIDEF